ncbi:Leucine-rich repeat-containing protein [Cynara cardunculus var. scolymus]|uniref:Leucine-rich repeat-containing protein n=1 Tax=Cynara cardunculus var. scolymus TaxID=59895 RepID=A0A103YI20_CYNCS|nr:Leucine-rich repeat-containing protein [Cynara cardunculus var. scolymus]
MGTSLLIAAAVFVLAVGTAVNGCPPSDRAALMAFKAALHEPYLGIFKSWTGNDCCNKWYGVSCDPITKRVADINLRGESEDPIFQKAHRTGYMNGSISPAICKLDRLSSVIIADWKGISGIIPPCISSLPFLRILDLIGNQISGQIPYNIGKLSRLTVLNIADNKITGRMPRNAIEGNIPDVFGPSSYFMMMDLSYNNLKGAIPKSIASASYIGHLDLSHNHLCGAIPAGSWFDHLEAASFVNNDCLCGKPLKSC